MTWVYDPYHNKRITPRQATKEVKKELPDWRRMR